jgi:hypothetical protein
MAETAQIFSPTAQTSPPEAGPENGVHGCQMPLLAPTSAWRVLCHRTGIPISRATFYRWLNSGRVFSFRLGQKFYVPMPIIDEIVTHCRKGERF